MIWLFEKPVFLHWAAGCLRRCCYVNGSFVCRSSDRRHFAPTTRTLPVEILQLRFIYRWGNATTLGLLSYLDESRVNYAIVLGCSARCDVVVPVDCWLSHASVQPHVALEHDYSTVGSFAVHEARKS